MAPSTFPRITTWLQILSETGLVVAALSFAWSLYLAVFGGFDVRIFGLSFTSNEPLRPLTIGLVAAFLFSLGSRPERRQRVWAAVAQSTRPAWMIPALAAGIALMGWTYATTAVGGADSYGYVSQAELWLQGTLKVEQPWVAELPWPNKARSATPLAYLSSPGDREGTIVPVCSPGLPLLMAAAKLVGGYCAMFLVVPICGGLMVAATYGIGRRLAMPIPGMIAAWLVATSPIFLSFLMVPMSDVPVAAAWSLAFYCMLGQKTRSALAAGLWSSLAVLIRPNLSFLVVVIAARYFFCRVQATDDRWAARMRACAVFLAGAAPGFVVVAAVYAYLYGSPLTSGYGRVDDLFTLSNFLPNVKRYVSWFTQTQTPIALVGLPALLLPVRGLWPSVPDRRLIIVMAVAVLALWAHYCIYSVFDDWFFLRFLLPSWPFLMLGVASVIMAIGRLRIPLIAQATALLFVFLLASILMAARSRGVFDTWHRDREGVAIAKTIGAHTPKESIFLTMYHSGSVRHYAGRVTLRYDEIDADWLDRAIAWLRGRGLPVYALLDDWEVEEFRRRFAGQAAVERLNAPAWIFKGDRVVHVYDFSRPTSATALPEDLTSHLSDAGRCEEPSPLVAPVLKRP